MATLSTKKKSLIYCSLTLVALLALGGYQTKNRGILNVYGAPTNKNFTFDKTTVPTGTHGAEGAIVPLSSSGSGRSDIVYGATSTYAGGYHQVALGGNYMMSLLPNTGASNNRILEFFVGITNITSVSVTIGHNLANPAEALTLCVFGYTGHKSDDISAGTGDFEFLVGEPKVPGTYHFDIPSSSTVGYLQIMYISDSIVIDTDHGDTMFIERVALTWSC